MHAAESFIRWYLLRMPVKFPASRVNSKYTAVFTTTSRLIQLSSMSRHQHLHTHTHTHTLTLSLSPSLVIYHLNLPISIMLPDQNSVCICPFSNARSFFFIYTEIIWWIYVNFLSKLLSKSVVSKYSFWAQCYVSSQVKLFWNLRNLSFSQWLRYELIFLTTGPWICGLYAFPKFR
jgi:hypothetical protein